MVSNLVGVVLAAALVAGCATTSDKEALDGNPLLLAFGAPKVDMEKALVEAAAFPLGSEQNPVRANMPDGQRAYLNRLRCSDGTAPAYQRGGSVGFGPFGGIMDIYELKCPLAEPETAEIYMDMYHGHVETHAVPGFTIIAP